MYTTTIKAGKRRGNLVNQTITKPNAKVKNSKKCLYIINILYLKNEITIATGIAIKAKIIGKLKK